MLEVHDLQVRYGEVVALKKVSLSVQQGQIAAVVGRNGAGKTTLLRAISGLMRPAGGTVLFAGVDVTGAPADVMARRKMAHVPQGRLVFGNQSVYDNLLLGAYSIRDQRKKIQANIEAAFAQFPMLAKRRHQQAGTLSGGEQQMLAIARGLMSDPVFIALDEPSLGLAPKLVKEVLQQIVRLNKMGLTVLLVEQMATAALSIAHRAYLLHDGEVRLQGTGSELLQHPELLGRYLGSSSGHTAHTRAQDGREGS